MYDKSELSCTILRPIRDNKPDRNAYVYLRERKKEKRLKNRDCICTRMYACVFVGVCVYVDAQNVRTKNYVNLYIRETYKMRIYFH